MTILLLYFSYDALGLDFGIGLVAFGGEEGILAFFGALEDESIFLEDVDLYLDRMSIASSVFLLLYTFRLSSLLRVIKNALNALQG